MISELQVTVTCDTCNREVTISSRTDDALHVMQQPELQGWTSDHHKGLDYCPKCTPVRAICMD